MIYVISKNKSQWGKIGTPYHIEKTHKERKVNCTYYDCEDGSCYKNSFLLWQVGYDICNTCKSKIPIEDEEIHNKNKNNKVPKVYDVDIQISKLLKSSSRIKQVLEMAENHCELCNKQTEHLEIYVLDKDKPIEDIDSLLNIIALCPKCKANVYKEKEKYIDDIKKKLDDRLDSII